MPSLLRKKLSGAEQQWVKTFRDEMDAQYSPLYAVPKYLAAGCSITMTVGGEIVFEEYRGRANLQTKVPWGPKTLCGVRSVTKEFTGAVICKLVEDGAMSWTDTIGSYDIIANNCTGLPPVGPNPGNPARTREPLDLNLTIRDFVANTCAIDLHGGIFGPQTLQVPNGTVTMLTDFDVKTAAEMATSFVNRSDGGRGRDTSLPIGPSNPLVSSYSDKGPQIAALCAEEAAGKKFWDLTKEMLEAYEMFDTLPSASYDSRVIFNSGYYSYSSPANAPRTVAQPLTTDGTGRLEGVSAVVGAVTGNGNWDVVPCTEFAMAIGTAWSTPADLAKFASRIYKEGYYLGPQGIADLTDNVQMPDNDGYDAPYSDPDGTGPLPPVFNANNTNGQAAGYFNATNPPWINWTHGGYRHRAIEGRKATGGVGFGFLAGHGAFWIAVPELDISVSILGHGGSLGSMNTTPSIAERMIQSYIQTFID